MDCNHLRGAPALQATALLLCGAVAACLCDIGASAAQTVRQRNAVGRFVALGMTDVSRAWKSVHLADENFIYVLDSATGKIEVCSDVEAICRSISGSERDSRGTIPGRFTGVKITRATAIWKAGHPQDDHLIYSLDSTNAQIQVCGDMEGTCAYVSNGEVHARNSWPKVVMLYRRADSAAIAGRMYDRFVAHFGEDAVFLDIYDIPLARDWREQVKDMTIHGGALVALIGPRWLGKGPDGHVRIQDIDDPVRTELETALDANVPVFPVLLEGASMPTVAELPDSLKTFSNVNAATVDTGRDFDQHIAHLIDAIDELLAHQVTPFVSK